MFINFRIREISRDMRKLIQIPMLIKKINKILEVFFYYYPLLIKGGLSVSLLQS